MADHALSPSQAAAIADGVYALKERTVAEHRERNAPMSSEDPLLDDASGFSGLTSRRFEARSGSVFWHELSGFGYIAEGAGPRAGELLIATRGTATAADALTDANFGFVIGPAGKLVHSGFMTCWKSYSRVLETALRGKSPRRIHCVGHSLGGALAMFNAEHLAQRRVAEVLVYTFGAPRVGDWFRPYSAAAITVSAPVVTVSARPGAAVARFSAKKRASEMRPALSLAPSRTTASAPRAR